MYTSSNYIFKLSAFVYHTATEDVTSARKGCGRGAEGQWGRAEGWGWRSRSALQCQSPWPASAPQGESRRYLVQTWPDNVILLIKHNHTGSMISHLLRVFVSTARKESAKEKQLKEEEKILESVAEGRGTIICWNLNQIYCDKRIDVKTVGAKLAKLILSLSLSSISSDVCEGNGQRYHIRWSHKNKVRSWPVNSSM